MSLTVIGRAGTLARRKEPVGLLSLGEKLMNVRGKSVGALCAVVLAAGAAVSSAAPASAASFSGTYVNHVLHTTEGSYSYTDVPLDIPDDRLTVTNVANGYHVRVTVTVLSGYSQTILNQVLWDGSTGAWDLSSTPRNALVRLTLCTLDRNLVQRGTCTTRETINVY